MGLSSMKLQIIGICEKLMIVFPRATAQIDLGLFVCVGVCVCGCGCVGETGREIKRERERERACIFLAER